MGTPAGDSYWLQVDIDVLDARIMPAVDSTARGGLDTSQLTVILVRLAPGAIGASNTIFDPDLDPDGHYANLVTNVVIAGLAPVGAASTPR